MKLLVFSVYDIKACAYERPFFVPTKGEAIRAFGDIAKEEKHPISKHPEDYRLHCLGEFDNESGKLVSKDVPEFLVGASDFYNKEVTDEK